MEALNSTSCVLYGELTADNRLLHCVMTSCNSCDCSKDRDGHEREEMNMFGEDAMPRDRASLEQELARLDELERQLQLETAEDFVQSCDLLLWTCQKEVVEAHAAQTRRYTAAQKLCEYTSQKARDTYASRCLELKRELNVEFEKELRRLQTAKDGVSVTSRRRRAVRPESFSTSKNANGLRRRCATSDGADVFASASPQERAHRVQFEEKKRLEQLLGRASVFQPAVEQVTPREIRDDLQALQNALVCRTTRKSSAKGAKLQLQKPLKRPRRRISTPRIPRTGKPDGSVSVTASQAAGKAGTKNRWLRLRYNPQMLQEGQEVQVFKRQRPPENGVPKHDECVASGILTAATRTHVYVLAASGRFESFDVRDCLLGSLYVQALDSRKECTR